MNIEKSGSRTGLFHRASQISSIQQVDEPSTGKGKSIANYALNIQFADNPEASVKSHAAITESVEEYSGTAGLVTATSKTLTTTREKTSKKLP